MAWCFLPEDVDEDFDIDLNVYSTGEVGVSTKKTKKKSTDQHCGNQGQQLGQNLSNSPYIMKPKDNTNKFARSERQ